jgi:hypothetical protein
MFGKAGMLAIVAVLGLVSAGCSNANGENEDQRALQPAAQARQRALTHQSGINNSSVRQAVRVTLMRVPNGGIQPQALMDPKGTLHLIYFQGTKANAGDLFYVRREAGSERFSEPIRINSQPGTACAMGSVRGGQIALGKAGRLHVVWNGVGTDYARLNDEGTAFETQRNLMRQTYIPDGGGTVAADDAGNVYVIWHGQRQGVQGEDKRQIWVARSSDDGRTFSLESAAWMEATGVCPCCSTRAMTDHKGIVYLLYRSATAQVNRDIYLLASQDRGQSFHESLVHKWKVPG